METNKEAIEKDLDSLRDDFNGIVWRIEDLQGTIQNILSMFEAAERDESEECFDILLKAGFNVGTKFKTSEDGPTLEIIGICNEGFRVIEISSAEPRKMTLRTNSKRYLDNIMPKLIKIMGE